MPVSRRTGKRYAAGSHSTKDGYEHVKVCAICGEKLVLSGGRALQFETTIGPNGAARGWHFDCGRPPS